MKSAQLAAPPHFGGCMMVWHAPPSRQILCALSGEAFALCLASWPRMTFVVLMATQERRGRLPIHTFLDYVIFNYLIAIIFALTVCTTIPPCAVGHTVWRWASHFMWMLETRTVSCTGRTERQLHYTYLYQLVSLMLTALLLTCSWARSATPRLRPPTSPPSSAR